MKHNLHFDFIVDKEKNTLTINREFAADREMVWKAYTDVTLLAQWFAPKPLTTTTKSMEFKPGGSWVYAMVEPNGTEYWGRMDYEEVNPIDFYSGLDGFCDERGVLNSELPRAKWEVTFTDHGENTIVGSVITYKSLNDLETIIQMGMQEGLTSTLITLDNLLAQLKNKPS